jgi:hypothetical protein
MSVVSETYAGAVYTPVADTVPSVAFPPATLLTSHVTFVFDAFDTLAMSCTVVPACAMFELADAKTIIGGCGGSVVLPPPHPVNSKATGAIRTNADTLLFTILLPLFSVVSVLRSIPIAGSLDSLFLLDLGARRSNVRVRPG